MAVLKGSMTRTADAGHWVLLQARIRPQLMDALRNSAHVSAVSYSLYVETLIDAAVQDDGRLPSYTSLISTIASRTSTSQIEAMETRAGTRVEDSEC